MSDMYVRDEETGEVVPHGQIHVRRLDGSLDVGFPNDEPSMADPSFEPDTNVNNVMKRHAGSMESAFHARRLSGSYADLSNLPNYQEMLHTVRDAQDTFNAMPADLRKKFDHDPAKLISFLSDPKNKDEAIALGLVNKPAPSNDEITQKNNDYLAGKIGETISKTLRPKKGSDE